MIRVSVTYPHRQRRKLDDDRQIGEVIDQS